MAYATIRSPQLASKSVRCWTSVFADTPSSPATRSANAASPMRTASSFTAATVPWSRVSNRMSDLPQAEALPPEDQAVPDVPASASANSTIPMRFMSRLLWMGPPREAAGSGLVDDVSNSDQEGGAGHVAPPLAWISSHDSEPSRTARGQRGRVSPQRQLAHEQDALHGAPDESGRALEVGAAALYRCQRSAGQRDERRGHRNSQLRGDPFGRGSIRALGPGIGESQCAAPAHRDHRTGQKPRRSIPFLAERARARDLHREPRRDGDAEY